MSTALLIGDELGFEVMSREEASLFFRLITYRYDRGAILITTNKSGRDWTELLAGGEVLAAAILDRLLHRPNVLNIKGRSYRIRDPRGHPEEGKRLSSATAGQAALRYIKSARGPACSALHRHRYETAGKGIAPLPGRQNPQNWVSLDTCQTVGWRPTALRGTLSPPNPQNLELARQRPPIAIPGGGRFGHHGAAQRAAPGFRAAPT